MKDFVRGFFWIGPAPYHDAYRRWSCGQEASCWIILSLIPIGIFMGGFVAGAHFR